MKVLKPLSSGLVCYEDFDTVSLAEPLRESGNYTRGTSCIEITKGSIYMNVYPYNNLVFEIENSFVPNDSSDYGGISIIKSFDRRDFYEYYEEGDNLGSIKYVRVVKTGEVYTGYGSNDGRYWFDRGYIIFPNAETIGVSVDSKTPYILESIKVYLSEFVTIHSVLPGWKLEVYKNGEKLTEVIATAGFIDVKLPFYPFTGTFKIYDEFGELVSDVVLSDVWGGDEYVCSVDVDILNSDRIPLEYNEAKHLGNLQGGKNESWYIVKNNFHEDVTVTLRIADYSPFGDWVSLAKDIDGVPGDYLDSITLTVPALDEVKFWIIIQRPGDGGKIKDYDFKNTECLFFLEVV